MTVLVADITNRFKVAAIYLRSYHFKRSQKDLVVELPGGFQHTFNMINQIQKQYISRLDLVF